MNHRAAWVTLALTLLCVLAGCSARNSDTTPVTAPASADADAAADPGARIYAGNCVPCHQPDARGIPGVYPSLVGSPLLLGDPRPLALWVIKGQRPASMPAGRYSTAMPQFGWMKAEDAAALLTYLRSHFGNAGSPVAADTVALALGSP